MDRNILEERVDRECVPDDDVARVLVLDNVDKRGVEILQQEGFIVEESGKLPEEKLCEVIGSYDALLVRSGTKVTEKAIRQARRLRVIGRAGVGVDNIDVDAATRAGIVVVNSPGGNTVAVAEHTMALILALARQIPQAHASMIEGKWERKKFLGRELRGKTLGILGLGRIGMAVARRAQAFEMKVTGHDPFVSRERAAEAGVELLSLEDLIAGADILTIHVPLTRDTHHLIDSEMLSKMKRGALLVNVARGGIVDEQALYEALVSGHLGGAALDVWEEEPPTDHRLLELPNVVGTPHLGASTVEAQEYVAEDVARDVVRVLRGELARNNVNLPSLVEDYPGRLVLWSQVAEQAGSLIGQLVPGCEAIEVLYTGEAATFDTALLTRFAVKGILGVVVDEEINHVNALVLAGERGITVTDSRRAGTGEHETGTIEITVRRSDGEEQSVLVSRSQANGEIRLLGIDRYRVDAPLSPHMLIAPHRDQPGIIGRVGTIIGREKINIAFMQVGRLEVGGDAVMVLGIDAPLPAEVVDELRAVPGINAVYPVELLP